MNNYLCINGKKTELTEQQLHELGIAPADEYIPENEIARMARIALSGKAEEYYKVHDTITVGGTVFEIIGIGHDTDTITNKKNTITLRSTFTDVRAAMHDGSCPGGYKDASLNARLTDTPDEWLPAEVLPFLRTVTKKCSNSDGEDYELPCRLFLFLQIFLQLFQEEMPVADVFLIPWKLRDPQPLFHLYFGLIRIRTLMDLQKIMELLLFINPS